MQQGLIVSCKTDHGLINGRITVGIQLHGLAHNVGRLGALAGKQTHFVHGIEQFPVRGLEAVNLRNGSGHNNGHGIGHVVKLQRLGDGLFGSAAHETNDTVRIDIL